MEREVNLATCSCIYEERQVNCLVNLYGSDMWMASDDYVGYYFTAYMDIGVWV